jgi:hypothetical protein
VITISIPDNFLPERRYIIDVLLGDFLGLEFETRVDHSVGDWEFLLPGGRKLIVEDHFFGQMPDASDYCRPKWMPSKVSTITTDFAVASDLPILYGKGQLTAHPRGVSIVCSADIMASAFFMLSRWEERAVKTRDEHGRFPATAGLASKAGFLERPLVNEYTELLWNMLLHLGLDQERRRRQFELVLTHDVDYLYLWENGRGFARSLAGDVVKRRALHLAISNLGRFTAMKLGLAADPYDTFDYLMTRSEKLGVTSRFYFMSGGNSEHDRHYSIEAPRARQLLNEIDSRGHRIGFHPSYSAFEDPAQWRAERDRLADISPQPITSGRQHYLRFEVPQTWQLWEENGMEYDSSLGYADAVGFRAGCCYDFPVFDIVARRPLRLRERPLIAMDGTLAEYCRLTPEQALDRLGKLAAVVKKYRGQFVMLWHNSSFYPQPWTGYRRVYEEAIERAL